LTEATLKRLLSKWKKRLRVNDWAVTARWATPAEVIDPARDWFAICNHETVKKSAEIIFLHPDHFTEEERKDSTHLDTEVDVVHELLHLLMAPFKTEPGSQLEDVEENLVHFISTLLVALEREDEKVLGLEEPLPKVAAIGKKARAKKS
jgi:hypothetical protein